jgi:hypothetical protein
VVLDNLTVDVLTDFEDIDSLTNQCLIEDNPGRIRILIERDASEATADIVVAVRGYREYQFGWLARAVKALDDARGMQSVTYENAVVYWR